MDMKITRAVSSWFSTSVVIGAIACATPSLADVIPDTNNTEQSSSQLTTTNTVEVTKNIPQLSEVELPKTSADFSVQSTLQGEVVQVTAVKVNRTDKGVEVILETGVKSESLKVTPKTDGNSYVADIPNAQLKLTSGETFRQEKPVSGITEVTVNNIDANNIRLTVTGEASVPAVELFDTDQGLVFGVTITATTSQQPTTTPEQTTPEQKPTPPTTEDEQKPIELEVTASPDTGYRVPNTSLGTKTDTPLRDIPGTVQVIPRQLIQDQGARSIADAVRNYGLIPSTNSSRIFDLYTIRGFEGGGNTLRNGLRDFVNRSTLGNDLSNVERIEILKGPASVLYGQLEVGGIINIVTKQPLDTPYYAVDFGVGSFGFYKPAIDLSGPVTSDKKLLYRLNADFENRDYFNDFTFSRRFQIAPVVTWRIGDNTTLTIEGQYYTRKTNSASTVALPAEGTVLPNPNGKIPLSRYVGEPKDDLLDRTTYRIGYNFKHRFSDNWSLQNAFNALFMRYNQNVASINGLRPDKRIATRTVQFYEGSVWNNYIMDTNLVGKFNTGSIQHQLLLGFDLYRNRSPVFANKSLSLAPIDLFNPVYGSNRGSLITSTNTDDTNDALGIYAQDQISLADNLKLVLGGRFDWVETKSIVTNYITSLSTTTSQADSAFTPRVGIVYQPIKPVSFYASYSRSFTQNVGGGFSRGDIFEPSRGTQYEVGVKADFGDKLSATLALFDLTKDNVLTQDLRDIRFFIQTGEQKSQGIELTLAGEILPGWNVVASYAYLDARITKDTRYPVGNRLQNAPEHTASLWTSYIVPQGDLKGWGLGLGLFYVGKNEGDLFNTFQLPSHLQTDAAIYYRKDNLDLSLNFKNIFDVEYYESARSILSVVPGDPFTVEFRAGWKF